MSGRFEWLSEAMRDADRQAVRRRLIPRRQEGIFLLEEDRRLINFGSNDYIGIVAERLAVVPDAVASGAASSPLVGGFTPLHQTLCEELATLEQSEAALLFPTGFAACCGVMASLPRAGDLVLSDALNHASLIDGCRLSKAERFIYPHRDAQAVDALLRSHRGRFARAFLVTESVFSMDGTRAPLEQLAEIAETYDVVLIVDEAHATGVLGERGGGLCESLGLQARIPIRIGTLSKAIGAQGGYATAPQVVVDYLIQHARTQIYSTAAPPSTIAAALSALRIIREHPERRLRVMAAVDTLTGQLRDAGLRVGGDRTPIVPVILGDPQTTLSASRELAERGLFVPAIRPPTVPANTSRLRISLSAAHNPDMVHDLARAIIQILQAPRRRP